jgi:hypothetical protein
MAVVHKWNMQTLALRVINGFRNKGHVWGWAHKVNIMKPHVLEGKEDFYKFIDRSAFSGTLMTDLKILAIDTSKVTG